MKFRWTVTAPTDPVGEEMWIRGGEIGFLVTDFGCSQWFAFSVDRRETPPRTYGHPCKSLADGKKIAEGTARKLVQ